MHQPLTTLKTESYYIIKIISIKNIDFVPTKTDISFFFSPLMVKSDQGDQCVDLPERWGSQWATINQIVTLSNYHVVYKTN
jgi:hypothetical protein